MKPLPACAATLLLTLLAGCTEVPVTGRHALNLVDDREVTKMSIAAFDDMKAHTRISNDRERNAQLQRVGDRIQHAVPIDQMPDADWEFVVFDSPEINAFAMAGGKVGVFMGLFKIVENDDQLASVIGHEIAHVTAKHINENLSQQMALQTGGMIGGIALMGTGASLLTESALMSAYGLGSDLSAAAFDRKKEAEADHIGIMYMAKAGYDPEEGIKVLERLEEETGAIAGAQPTFLSNHPSNPERIAQLRQLMPEALKVRERSQMAPPPPTIIK